MNINPKLWGQSSWNFMHYITLGYPDNPNNDVKTNTYNLFTSLKYMLPCEKCKYNYNIHISKHPLTNDILSSRNLLIQWLIDIHNEVNVSLNKPQITYNSIIESLLCDQQDTTPFSNISSRTLTIIIIIIVIVILLVAIRYK